MSVFLKDNYISTLHMPSNLSSCAWSNASSEENSQILKSVLTILSNLSKEMYIFRNSLLSLQNMSKYIITLVDFLLSVFDHILSSQFS